MIEMLPIEKAVALRPLARAMALICLPLVAGAVGASEPAQAQAVIKSQEPCTADGGACFVIRYRRPPIFPDRIGRVGTRVRGFGFVAPSAGTASLEFHGTLYCANGNFGLGHKVVDMVSQIVTSDSAFAEMAGASALRHANVFVAPNTSMTFNLASTRVVQVPAGPNVFYFVTRSLRTDSGVSCLYYNAAFSVTFVP